MRFLEGRFRWLVATVGSATWIALGAPPLDVWIAVPTGLALFAALLEARFRRGDLGGRRGWLAGAGTGFVFGTAVNVFALSFVPAVITRFTPLPWVAGALALLLVAMLQSFAFTSTALVTLWLRRWRVPLPLAFAFAHLVGTHAPAVFPWTVAAGLVLHPWSVQSAHFLGEPGAASLWALVGGTLALACFTRSRARLYALGGAAALSLGLYGYGVAEIAHVAKLREAAPVARIGLVHPAYPATMRWEPGARESLSHTLYELTAQAEAAGAELTVWPESAHPYPLAASSRRDLRAPFSILGPHVHGPVLAGALRRRDALAETNSAVLVQRGGAFAEPYDKLYLLAFGERVPLADDIPWLKRTFARGLGLVPGEHAVLQHSGSISAGIMICFEDTLPLASQSVAHAVDSVPPNLIANLTNDGWFTGTTEPLLHVRLASLRAIETRLDLVRSVNGGYTAHVDAAGRLVAEEHREQPSVLLAEARLLEHPPTIFGLYGETPAFLFFGLLSSLARLAQRKGAPPRLPPGTGDRSERFEP